MLPDDSRGIQGMQAARGQRYTVRQVSVYTGCAWGTGWAPEQGGGDGGVSVVNPHTTTVGRRTCAEGTVRTLMQSTPKMC